MEPYPRSFIHDVDDIWDALAAIPRTGWVRWGIPDPETVSDHTLAVCRLAISLQQQLPLTVQDFKKLLAMIEVHDWPEVITGDIVIRVDEPDAVYQTYQKHYRELQAMQQLCANRSWGNEVLKLYEEYDTGVTTIALWAKQLDKVQAVERAAQYSKQYQLPGLVQEFLLYANDRVFFPTLRERLKEIAQGVPPSTP